MRYYVTNIDWDTNFSLEQEKQLHLPEDIVVQSDSLNVVDFNNDEQVSNALSNYLNLRYGFQVGGFTFIDESEIISRIGN